MDEHNAHIPFSYFNLPYRFRSMLKIQRCEKISKINRQTEMHYCDHTCWGSGTGPALLRESGAKDAGSLHAEY